MKLICPKLEFSGVWNTSRPVLTLFLMRIVLDQSLSLDYVKHFLSEALSELQLFKIAFAASRIATFLCHYIAFLKNYTLYFSVCVCGGGCLGRGDWQLTWNVYGSRRDRTQTSGSMHGVSTLPTEPSRSRASPHPHSSASGSVQSWQSLSACWELGGPASAWGWAGHVRDELGISLQVSFRSHSLFWLGLPSPVEIRLEHWRPFTLGDSLSSCALS